MAEFVRPTSEMRSIALLRAQYVAVIVTLRSVGHVLQKVDADNAAKRKWLDTRWPQWKAEPIFATFIDPGRNALLKEARGLLTFNDPAVGSPAIVFDPSMPEQVSFLVSLDADAFRIEGRSAVELFREAVAFWDGHVREAEGAFRGLS